jgi:hypothetical protein
MLMVQRWVQQKVRWLALPKGLRWAMLMVKRKARRKEHWLALPTGLQLVQRKEHW